MVDIDENGIEFPSRMFGRETRFRGCQVEEVSVQKPAAWIARELRSEWHKTLAMPVDIEPEIATTSQTNSHD